MLPTAGDDTGTPDVEANDEACSTLHEALQEDPSEMLRESRIVDYHVPAQDRKERLSRIRSAPGTVTASDSGRCCPGPA